jgi:hypothetical protein
MGHGRRLKQVQDASHISPAELQNGLETVWSEFHVFFPGDMFESSLNLGLGQGRKTKAGTTGLKGRNDFANVVANETKASIFGVLFNDSSQGKLGVTRHGVSLIKNNQFDALVEELFGASKFFDFVTNDLIRNENNCTILYCKREAYIALIVLY